MGGGILTSAVLRGKNAKYRAGYIGLNCLSRANVPMQYNYVVCQLYLCSDAV